MECLFTRLGTILSWMTSVVRSILGGLKYKMLHVSVAVYHSFHLVILFYIHFSQNLESPQAFSYNTNLFIKQTIVFLAVS